MILFLVLAGLFASLAVVSYDRNDRTKTWIFGIGLLFMIYLMYRYGINNSFRLDA